MSLSFEWNSAKATSNLKKHGISFEEASTVFGDPRSFTIHDPDHSKDETRFIALGLSENQQILVVVFTERGDNIRLISARKANRKERNDYAQDDTD